MDASVGSSGPLGKRGGTFHKQVFCVSPCLLSASSLSRLIIERPVVFTWLSDRNQL